MNQEEEKDLEDFRSDLVKQISSLEKEERAFSSWLFKFDHMRENIY